MLRGKLCKLTVCTLIGFTLVVVMLTPLAPTTTVTAQDDHDNMVQVYLWAGSGPTWEYYTTNSTTYIGLYYYWFAQTEDQIQDFLDSVTVEVSLNGRPLFDDREAAHIFWAPIEPFVQQGQSLFRAEWSAMLIPLDPGEYAVSFALSLDDIVEDGVASEPFGPGLIQNTTNIVTVIEEGTFFLPEDTAVSDGGDDTATTDDDATKPVNVPPPDPDAIYDEPVVGTFVGTAQAHWAPEGGKVVTPEVYFQAGTTLWVFGLDSTRQYYKVLIDIVYLWVPVGTIGPTYDSTWGGRPLPNIVVK